LNRQYSKGVLSTSLALRIFVHLWLHHRRHPNQGLGCRSPPQPSCGGVRDNIRSPGI